VCTYRVCVFVLCILFAYCDCDCVCTCRVCVLCFVVYASYHIVYRTYRVCVLLCICSCIAILYILYCIYCTIYLSEYSLASSFPFVYNPVFLIYSSTVVIFLLNPLCTPRMIKIKLLYVFMNLRSTPLE